MSLSHAQARTTEQLKLTTGDKVIEQSVHCEQRGAKSIYLIFRLSRTAIANKNGACECVLCAS